MRCAMRCLPTHPALRCSSSCAREVKQEAAQPIVDAVQAAQNGSLHAEVELDFLVASPLLAAKMALVTATQPVKIWRPGAQWR